MTSLEKQSHCKVNLLLNILGKRADGFHELETVMQPIRIFDRLSFKKTGRGIALTCSEPSLPVDSRNLVFRAAEMFMTAARLNEGVEIHLEKHIPMAAGLGGGSGNAAITLKALNELFDFPVEQKHLESLASALGSDVPFFLQDQPALGTGRGEIIRQLAPFAGLRDTSFILIHPGFGIPTSWAYHAWARFSNGANGQAQLATELISRLQQPGPQSLHGQLYNSLEAPALEKFPILALYQDFFRENGAFGTLMSGSGSTTFAIAANLSEAEVLTEKFKSKFGDRNWRAIVRNG